MYYSFIFEYGIIRQKKGKKNLELRQKFKRKRKQNLKQI